jgi:alpha-N-arabinofuranosidase
MAKKYCNIKNKKHIIIVMKKIFLFVALMNFCFYGYSQSDKIYIDFTKKGHNIQKSMYGIFFEEINHGGEGGIYPDLIKNRAFEEQVIPSGFTYKVENGEGRIYCPDAPHHETGEHRNFNWAWNIEAKKFQAWTLTGTGCTVAKEITADQPLHENTPNAFRLTISNATANAKAELINSG